MKLPPQSDVFTWAYIDCALWSSLDDDGVPLDTNYDATDLAPETLPRQRLAYDELLANQLALLLIRAQLRGLRGRPIPGSGKLKAKVLAALPFALTDPQLEALGEIEKDMASDKRMLRLLQGDVGSGKTIVAFLALLDAIPESPWFGVNFDPSNAIIAGDDPLLLLQDIKHRVVSMHASDRYFEGGNLEEVLKYRH